MPSNLIINTESVIGYNNFLVKASDEMKFGVNDSVNIETKQVGIKHNLGFSKVNPPHLEIRKLSQQSRGEAKEKPKAVTKAETAQSKSITNSHDLNIAALTISAAGIAWYLFR